jgi:hypothetical protein
MFLVFLFNIFSSFSHILLEYFDISSHTTSQLLAAAPTIIHFSFFIFHQKRRTSLLLSMAKNHKKYRKDKPWDTDDIDHWKVEEWKPEYLNGNLLEESSFATLFPKYREKYLREVWPITTKTLEVCITKIKCVIH